MLLEKFVLLNILLGKGEKNAFVRLREYVVPGYGVKYNTPLGTYPPSMFLQRSRKQHLALQFFSLYIYFPSSLILTIPSFHHFIIFIFFEILSIGILMHREINTTILLSTSINNSNKNS